MARRLVERGVRFVQVYHTVTSRRSSCQLWDQHGGLKAELPANCAATDLPIAGLLIDLKARGLLKDTLVIWGGEFGRTPTAEGTDGREHHPFGFTMWLAGGGIKGGITYGNTDDYGWHAIENRVHVHDLHATILHLMGIDHTKLTYRYSGRDYRLTDVFGNVVHPILA
jgi:arylsulfatase A-like enzyme